MTTSRKEIFEQNLAKYKPPFKFVSLEYENFKCLCGALGRNKYIISDANGEHFAIGYSCGKHVPGIDLSSVPPKIDTAEEGANMKKYTVEGEVGLEDTLINEVKDKIYKEFDESIEKLIDQSIDKISNLSHRNNRLCFPDEHDPQWNKQQGFKEALVLSKLVLKKIIYDEPQKLDKSIYQEIDWANIEQKVNEEINDGK